MFLFNFLCFFPDFFFWYHYFVLACKNGWSYDQTWYENTIPTQENWVCAKDLYVTNVFVVGRVTEVAGSFLLGQMGDM